MNILKNTQCVFKYIHGLLIVHVVQMYMYTVHILTCILVQHIVSVLHVQSIIFIFCIIIVRVL